MIRRRRFPSYAPGSDGTLEMWLDPSDSSTLLTSGGGAISNGATIGDWVTKGGTTRHFTQWQTFARPTWDSTAINGLGAVRSQTQIITNRTAMSNFDAIGGLTVMRVVKTSGTAGVVLQWTTNDGFGGGANVTHFGQGGDVPDVSGWRRPNVDTFQDLHISPAASNTVSIFTSVWDFTNARWSIYNNGTEGSIDAAFGSAGNTAGTMYAISFGGFVQETGLTATGFTPDGYTGETLVWLSAKSPDSLVAPHHYLRRKWGGGLL